MQQALSFNKFPIIPEASLNDNSRPGSLILEYREFALTVSTNAGTAEVPTGLGEVVGVIPLGYSSVFGAADAIYGLTTDGVITDGAVTVQTTSTSIADGSVTCRCFLVGRRSETAV